MKTRVHALAAIVAMLCILAFWLSTAISDLFLSTAAVVAVRRGIWTAMGLLVPALAATGASGFALARGRTDRLAAQKKQRMRIIAANGLLILLPSAYYLCGKASVGQFDRQFVTVQGIELAAGALNLGLMMLNLFDSLKLTGRFTSGAARSP